MMFDTGSLPLWRQPYWFAGERPQTNRFAATPAYPGAPMKHLTAVFVLIATAVLARAQDGDKQTIEFVQKLQTPDGGFLMKEPPPEARLTARPTLRATSAAVRALHYLGGKLLDPKGAATFVASCYDEKSGGFADQPSLRPDVTSTAIGLLAIVDLKMPREPYVDGALRYFADNVKSFEDIRIAAAGLEKLDRKSAKHDEWLAAVKKLQNADGTFGKDHGLARDTGGASVVLLRLGETLPKKAAVLKAMRDGQQDNGGFGKGENDADLETTYRVMRCFMMLKEQPTRVEGLRTFVAKCRNEDGGYGIAPGEPSTVPATYFATIVKKWLE